MTRRICAVTGSRADYGHLQSVMRAIHNDPDLTLQTIVCGQHLEPRFGETWRSVAMDGFDIDGRVVAKLTDDSNAAVADATGRTIAGLARELTRLAPDIVLLLGDRYEIMAAGTAALLLRIPIAHIHGGEITEAAFDDSIRHALSKMAVLHFAAAEPYRQRLIHMGEQPDMVHTTGAPGLDDIDAIPAMEPATIAEQLKITVDRPLFVVTYHPVTLSGDGGAGGMDALLQVLGGYQTATTIFTGVNSDPGHEALRNAIAAFVARDPKHRAAVASLGRVRYLSLVKAASAVIGNSSSGLIEAPSLGTPTVNIGDRQKGRLRSASVIDCAADAAAIAAAFTKALDPAFREHAGRQTPAYGSSGAAQRIADVLKQVSLAQLSTKRFHDIIAPT